MVDDEGHMNCAFTLGKSRQAPLKSVTIPRLELQAAVTAVRVDDLLRRELRIPLLNSVFWTDSTTVLQYLTNHRKRFKMFVANRIAKILDKSSPDQWHYVNTKDNPADDASRGLYASEMIACKRWKYAPQFSWKSECHWLTLPIEVPDLQHDDVEVRQPAKYHVVVDAQVNSVDRLFERYSSWFRLKRAVA